MSEVIEVQEKEQSVQNPFDTNSWAASPSAELPADNPSIAEKDIKITEEKRADDVQNKPEAVPPSRPCIKV